MYLFICIVVIIRNALKCRKCPGFSFVLGKIMFMHYVRRINNDY